MLVLGQSTSFAMSKHPLIASVDMGSSSFRLVVARVEELNNHPQIYMIDSLREPVRLGAGLDEHNNLSQEAQTRAIEALHRFGERIRAFKPEHVHAVATNAVRVANNGAAFIEKAEAALGFPIDVVAGVEEARLVYCGVAHQLPIGMGQRLVVDIGGGSTEFILGEDYNAIAMESLDLGCISIAQAWFADGTITKQGMRNAILETRQEVAGLRQRLPKLHWTHAVGSSGTARALAEICISNGFTEHGISAKGLEKIKNHVIEVGHLDAITLNGLKDDRLPMMPGGLAVMCAVFEELGIEHMEVTEGGLRQGLLYDLLGREHQADMRQVTVNQFVQRYHIDQHHAQRVSALATELFTPFIKPHPELQAQLPLLQWAALLHEVGLAIGHNNHQKHAAYLLNNADMPGFSKREQTTLANWVLAQSGKLHKALDVRDDTPLHWAAPLCLRLAALLLRRRSEDELPTLKQKPLPKGMQLSIPKHHLDTHPLTQYNLELEVEQWAKVGLKLSIKQQKNK